MEGANKTFSKSIEKISFQSNLNLEISVPVTLRLLTGLCGINSDMLILLSFRLVTKNKWKELR